LEALLVFEAFLALDRTTRLVVLGVVIVAVYGICVRLFPYRHCPYCAGGKRFVPGGEHFNTCKHCRGTAQQARGMARVFGYRD
jgi:hypothetical protein